MLKKFNEILRLVKEYNNNAIAHYIAVEIAKIVYKEEKATPSNTSKDLENKILKEVKEFWYWHNAEKKRSNYSKEREAATQKLATAQYIVKLVTLEQFKEIYPSNYAEWIYKVGKVGYIKTLNSYGKLDNKISMA